MHQPRLLSFASIAASLLLGCAALPPPPAALALAPISPDERAQQTRLYETDDRAALLGACIAVLRRHGFAAEDQDAELGVIVAAKDATDGRERTRLRASIAAAPAGEFGLETSLRLTLQRLAWNARGRETKREAVREASEYAGFFDEVARELGAPGAGPE
ncbi:MAG TPA: hypothetical protein VFT98_02530 [Myxococcota bacterium]|nr:hypothetical protein [Myxococcota bacterium]